MAGIISTAMDELDPREVYWRDHQPWLLSLGYQLRPRYRPGWVASWITHPLKDGLDLDDREDYISGHLGPVMDAVRVSDNKPVIMKKIASKEDNLTRKDEEHLVSEYVSTSEQLRDPDNHCVPVIEVLPDPQSTTSVIVVMPQLREWTSPRLDTIGEALDMIHQAFKGLQYLHRNHIAHRDCTGFNFMMDGSEIYPEGFHSVKQNHNIQFTGGAVQKYTRTQRPPRYYWIDFGLSVAFDASDDCPRAVPVHAGDKTAPEYRNLYSTCGPHQPNDPFPIDIYYLGNMVRMFFTEGSDYFDFKGKYGFQFLDPLVKVMVQDHPANRPNIDECVKHLEEIIQAQSSWTLRSQVWHRTDTVFGIVLRFFPHWARRVVYIITQAPAIPSRTRPPSPYLPLYTRILLGLWYIFLYGVCFFPKYFIGPITFLPFLSYLLLDILGFIFLFTQFGPILFDLIYPMFGYNINC